MWSKFKALIPYLGGKRQLAQQIFKHIKPPSEAPLFVDAFMGGGSMSLLAKAKGYQVLANDLSDRSVVVGKALIENDNIKIRPEDVAMLTYPFDNNGHIRQAYVPKVFTSQQAEFLDSAVARIKATENETKRALLTVMLIKHILSIRNFSKFTHTKDTVELEARRFDYPLKNKSQGQRNLRMIGNPYTSMRPIAESINHALFTNGRENKVYQLDAVVFAQLITADTIYFDPPYADTSSYESEYKVLDDIFASEETRGKKERISKNPWSESKTAREEFEKLFTAAKHIPNWLISMGQTRSETGISAEELLEMVKKHRPAYIVEFSHRWSVGNSGGEKQVENKEYLIVSK